MSNAFPENEDFHHDSEAVEGKLESVKTKPRKGGEGEIRPTQISHPQTTQSDHINNNYLHCHFLHHQCYATLYNPLPYVPYYHTRKMLQSVYNKASPDDVHHI